MLKGIHLTLLIGPVVPVPAPHVVVDALNSVQVTSGGTRGGFQLTFAASKSSTLTRTLVPAGYFDPGIRVIIIVTLGGIPNVLMDGIITQQSVAPSNEAGQSTLTVTGEDLSVLMDLVEMPFMRYPAMPELARVLAPPGRDPSGARSIPVAEQDTRGPSTASCGRGHFCQTGAWVAQTSRRSNAQHMTCLSRAPSLARLRLVLTCDGPRLRHARLARGARSAPGRCVPGDQPDACAEATTPP